MKNTKYREQAIGEAIYWWTRDEYYYHLLFTDLSKITEKLGVEFISEKVLNVFMSQYSVRRTLKAGMKSEILFLNELFSTRFYNAVKKGKTSIIEEKKDEFKSGNNSIKSALSKFAALCNPSHFIMFDSRARVGLHRLQNDILGEKVTYSTIDNYNEYLKLANSLKVYFEEKELLEILNKYSSSNSIDYLKNNIPGFQSRVIDKWLWLIGSEDYEHKLDNYLEISKYRV